MTRSSILDLRAVRAALSLAVVAAALLASVALVNAGSPEVLPVEPDGGIGDTPVVLPVEPDGGIGDTPEVLPVEPDGGIGDTPEVLPVEPDGGIGD